MYTSSQSLKSITEVHIEGYRCPNAIYGNINDRIIPIIGENPIPPNFVPGDDEITTFGNRASVTGNKGILYKQDGTAAGPLF